jgi:ATP-binding cassette subfamily B protein
MKWVFKYLKPLSARITVGIIIKIIGTLAELMIPFLLSYILENVISTNDVGNIIFYGVLMAICAIVACIGNIVANRMAAKTTMIFSTHMRRDLFSKTLHLSPRNTDRFTIPSLEARITSDTYNVQNFIGMMQRMGIRAPILLLGGTAITMLMDRKLALVMIATLPLIFIVVYSISRKGVPLYTTVQQSVDGMVRVVREDAQGIRVIKALSKIDYENERYDKANMTLRRNETRAGIIMGVVNPIMTLLMNAGIVAVIAVSAFFVSNGTSSATTVIAFMQYFTLISMAMMSLSRMFVMYTKCSASASRISLVMDSRSELEICEDDGKGDPSLHIAFENVSFSYNDVKEVLKGIDLDIRPGETVAIVGHSGGGKTTLCQLIPRFYDVTGGRITIDGTDIRDVTKSSIRQNVGIVQQDVFIFADTILENIRYGKPDATYEEVVRAAKRAEIYDDIMAMPDQFETYVGERGTKLSGGQKQRVSIARIFLKDPKILILDEATSALDTITEEHIQESFEELAKGRTTIVIAHRLSTVQDADRIVVVEDGLIVEEGTHEELLAKNGEYAKLYNA